MTHDPLCLASRASVVCLHCAGENDNRGKSNYCSDCWDHYVVSDLTEPVPECQCDLIARARADERDQAVQRVNDFQAEVLSGLSFYPMGDYMDGLIEKAIRGEMP
jgi:hypothetical protein